MPVRGRPRLIASKPNTTKLYVDDLREVVKLSQVENKTMSDLIRELVHEAFRYRRLHALAQDEGESQVRKLYHAAVLTGLQPVTEQLTQLQQTLDALTAVKTSPFQPHEPRATDRLGQAQLALSAHLLRGVLATENAAKILLTVGMQKDELAAAEIQTQLGLQDETAHQQAQQFMQKLLADYRLTKPVAAGGNAAAHIHTQES